MIQIGRHTYGAPKVLWADAASLTIGAFCSIGPSVIINLGGEHRPDWVTTYPFTHKWGAKQIKGHPATKGNVKIGNDVWIGTGAFITSGVTIGDGAVIGSRSIVASNVDPYSIYVGNPARIVRKRFSDQQIESLLKIAWWNWDDKKIAKFIPLLLNNSIDAFIAGAK